MSSDSDHPPANSHTGSTSRARDLARLLASYARDGLARGDAPGDAPVPQRRTGGPGEGPRRQVRGRAGRGLLPLHTGADPLLRHLLRLGTLGPAVPGPRRPLQLARRRLAPARPGDPRPLPATLRPRQATTPGPRGGAGLDRRRPRPGGPPSFLPSGGTNHRTHRLPIHHQGLQRGLARELAAQRLEDVQEETRRKPGPVAGPAGRDPRAGDHLDPGSGATRAAP